MQRRKKTKQEGQNNQKNISKKLVRQRFSSSLLLGASNVHSLQLVELQHRLHEIQDVRDLSAKPLSEKQQRRDEHAVSSGGGDPGPKGPQVAA